MKTSRNLYPQIATFSNLLLAFEKARKGKRGKAGVAAFEYNLERELLRLSLWPASRRATQPTRSGEQPYGKAAGANV